MSDDNTSLIHIDGKHFGKAAQLLIEKVSAAVGGTYRPTHIRRIAKAEADAAVIAAEGEVKIGDLQYRAAQRWLAEESRKQENIESITEQAIPLLDETADASNVEEDWIANFFEKSRTVSDGDMQSLWARVLAGEANSPGKYSRKTVNLISDLDKTDAHLFANLCGFMWNFGGLTPLVFDQTDDIYKSQGITFSALNHLSTLGLINFGGALSYKNEGLPQQFSIQYFDQLVVVRLPDGRSDLQIGKTLFTNAGKQLAEICQAKPVPGFFQYSLAKFEKDGAVFPPSIEVKMMSLPPEFVPPPD